MREREFNAGRYNPVIPFLDFPIGPNSPAPGAQHQSIGDIFEDAAEDGTRSILDLNCISDEPESGAVTELKDHTLQELFGTTRPTLQMIHENFDLWDSIERGQGIYILLYKNDQPDEIFFAGYSYD